MKPTQLALDTQQGGRRAALAVHALSAQDREWILQQLPAGQRERPVLVGRGGRRERGLRLE